MGEMGMGYGSECHLLRYLGRHRKALDSAVLRAMGVSGSVDWLDYPFERSKKWMDAEWKGLDFLQDQPSVQAAWRAFWPQGAGIHNWDAVGWLLSGGRRDLVLVEAKGNIEEISSNCNAKEEGGLPKIREAMAFTRQALGILGEPDWLRGTYQVANRLAVLAFLEAQGVQTRLVFIYFYGDCHPSASCPASIDEWESVLKRQAEQMGLQGKHAFSDRVHKVFLPVCLDPN